MPDRSSSVPPVPPAARVTPSPEVLFQELDGETVLLDLGSERYFGLDDVGTRVWQLLLAHGELAAVHRQMLAEYEVPAERLREDLLELVARLEAAGLVRVEREPDDAS